jgi:Tol biopolymer transport system component
VTRLALLLVAALVGAGCGAAAAPSAPRAATSTPAVVATSTVAPTVTDAPSPTATPIAVRPGEAWLAFQGDQGEGQYGIRLVRPDGTGLHAIAPSIPGQYQLHPDWSPDGSRLVFAEVGAAATDLWIVDADGGNAKHIVDCSTGCSRADEPAWSPDGASLAFHREAFDGSEVVSTLELYDVATGVTRVVRKAADDRLFFAPRWAPDSKRVVAEYHHRTSPTTIEDMDSGELVVVDTTATSAAKVITAADYWPGDKDWSPDGKTIVFFHPEDPANFDGPTDLWTIHPDGTGLTRLTHFAKDAGQAVQPAFSPDGSRIVFVASSSSIGDGVMASIAVDGSDLQPATTSGYLRGAHPRLRPTP